jgi:hypothetical protein
MMESEIMHSGLLRNGTGELRRRPGTKPGCDRLTICLESSIRADARQLFYALTAPEYLETWILFPGHSSGCSTVATKLDKEYVIAHLCDGIRNTIIFGSYQVCERRNVVLSWRVAGAQHLDQSQVDIRLSGDFEFTT